MAKCALLAWRHRQLRTRRARRGSPATRAVLQQLWRRGARHCASGRGISHSSCEAKGLRSRACAPRREAPPGRAAARRGWMEEPEEDAGEARQRRASTAEEREARVQALLQAALPSPRTARRASTGWPEPRRSQGGEAQPRWVARLSEPSPRRSEPRHSPSAPGSAEPRTSERRARRSSAASASRGAARDDAAGGDGSDEAAEAALPVALVEARARLAAQERALADAQLAAERQAAALRADREALDADRAAFEVRCCRLAPLSNCLSLRRHARDARAHARAPAPTQAERQQVLEALARLQEAGRATSGEFAALEVCVSSALATAIESCVQPPSKHSPGVTRHADPPSCAGGAARGCRGARRAGERARGI